MIGSHNSMSYLLPKNLWGKITRLWNKCQDKTIEEQFNSGVRVIYDQRSKPKNASYRTNRFITYLWILIKKYNVNIDSAITYWDWKEHYKPLIEVKEYHASVSAEWYQYLLGCKWFAKHYNNYAKKRHYGYSEDNERVLLLDYV